MSLVYFTIAWFLGICLAKVVPWSLNNWLVVASIGGVTGLFFLRQPNGRSLPLMLLALGLGAARYQAAQPAITPDHIAYYNGTPNLILTGLVVAEPDIRDKSINLRVEVENMVLSQGNTAVHGTILVQAPRFPVIAYGTRIQIIGDLETPPTGEDFNYRDYLARQQVYSLVPFARITVLSEGQGNPIYQRLFAFKAQAQATINRLIPEPEASLLSGILLGNDSGMPADLIEAFRRTGTTHIIAISGFNISILIAILIGLTEPFLPRRAAFAVAVGGILLYTLLVGASASVVRAAIMGTIYLFTTRLLGRPNFAFASLFLAGLVMTLLNPFTLWDVGFQLSFAATLSLMLYADPFTQWVRQRLLRWMARDMAQRLLDFLTDAVILTLAAQVLTLPLMIAYFGQVSLISLPTNALVLPIQPAVMVWGGIAVLAGLFIPIPAIGQALGWVSWLFLVATTFVIRLFASVPGAAVPVSVSPVGIGLIYALIAALTVYGFQEADGRSAIRQAIRERLSQGVVLAGSLVTAVLVLGWAISQPDGRLHIAFFDVGQGDATFIQTPSGRQILVDGGLYPTLLNDQLGRQMPFWDKTIDLLVATHPDADHVTGLAGVFDHYNVDQLITDGEGLGASDVYDAVLQATLNAHTPIHRAMAGELFDLGDGVVLEVLHPGDTLDEENRNENSVAMRLVYGNFSYLFTGDGESDAEQAILEGDWPVTAVVFKAGHHGSRTSSGADLLAAVRPLIIIVSAGEGNRYGHPHPEMLQRAQDIGAVVLRTDELGPIYLETDGQTMSWSAGP